MSANAIRFDRRTAKPDLSSPLQKGNRVLESIARQEAFRSLLAFSGLREQLRNPQSQSDQDLDLFETERFILDEVLQLICDRAEAITSTDGILVALTEGPDLVCRAASGELAVARGFQLNDESEFLRECLETGRILRCNDCATDARSRLDLARVLNARSTLLIPLNGNRQQLGVLQVFSSKAHAFTDRDVRCFDLFAELVLSALKPEDQDRRVGWLSNVAEEVLHPRPEVADTVAGEVACCAQMGVAPSPLSRSEIEYQSKDTDIDEPVTERSSASEPVAFSLSLPSSARPGLGVVLSLVAIAALFAAGTWRFMQSKETQNHSRTMADRVGSTKPVVASKPPTKPAALPTDVLSLEISDNLMNSPNAATDGGPAPAPTENKAGISKITGVRHWSSSVGSTVVIDMEDEVPYEVHRLASPERIYFDLHGTALSPELEGKTVDVGDASLTRVRIGQPVAGITRVVLDTKDGANFSVSMESSPYRLVVELRNSEKTAAAARPVPNHVITAPASVLAGRTDVPAKAAPIATLPAMSLSQPLLAKSGKFRIVLDAGHGGWDLGTVGRRGLLEKDLVLDVTERLGKLLQTRLGSEVLFTRTDDTYLPLDQRADIANQAQADLFVSVHANYSTSTSARGIETYYTNLFSAPGSKDSEKHEDGSFTKLTPVSLSIEGLHEKIEESRRLAISVQRSLYATLSANSPDIRNRGIKDAAFAVLTGTTMPSILTEISFVSSPTDERNLQSPAYRQQVAEALYQGIARYQQSSAHMKVAQLQNHQ